jgi:hypothetical protein
MCRPLFAVRIRLEEYIVPDSFWVCAERRCSAVLRDPNAILSAIDTTQTRTGLVLCLTVLMNDLQRVPDHSTRDPCVFHQLPSTLLVTNLPSLPRRLQLPVALRVIYCCRPAGMSSLRPEREVKGGCCG